MGVYNLDVFHTGPKPGGLTRREGVCNPDEVHNQPHKQLPSCHFLGNITKMYDVLPIERIVEFAVAGKYSKTPGCAFGS